MLMLACPLLQFCTTVMSSGLPVSIVGGHCSDVISASVALPVAIEVVCSSVCIGKRDKRKETMMIKGQKKRRGQEPCHLKPLLKSGEVHNLHVFGSFFRWRPPLPSLHWRLLPGVVRDGSSNSGRSVCSHAPVALGHRPLRMFLVVWGLILSSFEVKGGVGGGNQSE
jgi:hypothetical protein